MLKTTVLGVPVNGRWTALFLCVGSALHRLVVAPLLIVALAAGALGCTSMKTVRPSTDPSNPVFGKVKAGDAVVLYLADGRRLEITVARVDRDALVSAQGVRYERAEIVQLQKRAFSGPKTVGFVAAAYAAAIAAVIAALGIAVALF